MADGQRRLAAFCTAIGVFLIDRASKWLVETRLGAYDTVTVIPRLFNIVRSENPGVAFGIFAESTSQHRTLALIAVSCAAVLVLAAMLWRIDRLDRLTASGLSLIFGGALGNVFDRVRFGRVTDFLDFYFGSYHWYTFNLADTAIFCGAGLMLISMWKTRELETA